MAELSALPPTLLDFAISAPISAVVMVIFIAWGVSAVVTALLRAIVTLLRGHPQPWPVARLPENLAADVARLVTSNQAEMLAREQLEERRARVSIAGLGRTAGVKRPRV